MDEPEKSGQLSPITNPPTARRAVDETTFGGSLLTGLVALSLSGITLVWLALLLVLGISAK